ncbi:MAG: LysM peptidoglycan-binding domain-containing protein [Chloroflexi bacterium]|nr:LysM peptidoglycan-binding domain-containing protein [Chloroflexota bacterium]
MRKPIHSIIWLLLFGFALSLFLPKEVSARPLGEQISTPSQLIAVVNNLRISNGLPALSVHPILNQAAQSQADYMAATGNVTHTRPGGITYTQQLLALGFPLAGDLSLGGFRAENILYSNGYLNWNGVPPGWQDAAHMNTMLSGNFTHIGAGISQGANNAFYYAVDTAAATGSGQMQDNASTILTSVPGGVGDSAGVSQFMVPVAVSTARADGDVMHTVQYGQSLWSIAIEYGTTIKNIQALNNLGEYMVVYQGQQLLVLKAATQPALSVAQVTMTPMLTETPIPTATFSASPTPMQVSVSPTSETAETAAPTSTSSSRILVVVLILAAFVGASMAVWLIRDPSSS